MAGRSGLEGLELTGEEVARLRRAFQDEGFRRLFAEYAAELADPAQRAAYEAEVVALERQRGVEARFLHPTPGWVLRTSQAGARRCYLNVCGCGLVGRPEARPEPGGSTWRLPHCLAPGREELLGRPPRRPAPVYDVLFHPEALRLAARSARFRRLVDETALEAVERHFAPGLDRANAAPLRRAKYQGVPQATLLRTPLPGAAAGAAAAAAAEGDADGGSPLPPCPTPYAYPPPPAPPPAQSPPLPEPAPPAAAATPRWTLRQRCFVDLQDYRCSRDSAPSPVPRELEVTVELPLLRSAAQAQLEVRERELRLDSRRPAAAYRLRLPLPYAVDEEGGRATFDKAARRLVVTLPVRRRPDPRGPGGGEAPPEEPPGSERPGPAAHVGADHVQLPVGSDHAELPVCAAVSSPVEAGAGGRPGESALTRPAPLGLPGSGDRGAGDAASFSIEASACDRSPDSGAREDECQEPDCVSLAPDEEGRAGGSVELPACPGAAGPSVTPAGLGTAMDLGPCPEVASAVPSSELGGATVPATHLCAISSDHPECHRLSTLEQNVEACASTGGSRDSRSCRSPVAPACSNAALSVTAVSATTNRPPGSPLLSGAELGVDPEAVLSPSSGPDTPLPPSSPTPPLCPPFQGTQDEEALMLLLQVPGIVPQSLKGELGTHQYRVSFASKDLISYTLFLQLPPENKLTSPETSISVSLDNAVIHLRKAPETIGLWTKLYFGLNEDAVQEKLFVTEDNVAGFLDSLRRPSCPSQPETERQPSIEVLDVSERQSRIRFKAQERNSSEGGKTQQRVDPGTAESEHPVRAESHPLLPDSAAEQATETKKASDSLTAAETKEPAGWGLGHCLEPDPADSGFSPPGKLQITKLQESELALTTATAQTQPDGGEPAGTREAACPGSAERGSPPAPVLRETDMGDGSVQLISHHTTHCAVTFQNPLLYELD